MIEIGVTNKNLRGFLKHLFKSSLNGNTFSETNSLPKKNLASIPTIPK